MICNCKNCGKQFIKTHGNQIYCSENCAKKAKKRQDKTNSHKRYTLIQENREKNKATCEYCGKQFTKTHGNQKYCSKNCKENRILEQNADAALRYYHHTKKLRGGDTTWGLGSGGLGSHAITDFEKEHYKIQKELKRLKLT